jgi:hypothetical protein
MGLLFDSGLAWPIYNKRISDWVLGDDRRWNGTFPMTSFPATPETGISDVYLTIKSDPTQSDANSLVQVHITPTSLPAAGVIVVSGGICNIAVTVLGSTIVGSTSNLGPWYYDIRAISIPTKFAWTFESGQIQFQQNVTGALAAGTPAALPNAGLPVFRGFAFGPPTTGTYNTGDWFRNMLPVPGGPSGWVCIVGGTPGTWVTDGIVGLTTGA